MLPGAEIFINLHALHHNPEQWQRSGEFLPERFDPSSPLYLTPKGNKRHAMSFTPFSGGQRVCFGKTFAEYSVKVVCLMLLNEFDFKIHPSQAGFKT